MSVVVEPAPEIAKTTHHPFWLAFIVVLGPLFIFRKLWLPPIEPLYSDWSDGIAQQYPFVVLLVESLRDWGLPPVWNPYSFCGMPLLGDPQAWVFYLPAWVCALVPPVYALHTLGPFLLFHILLGALGTSYWLGQQGRSGAARVAGAWTFALAGKWMAHVLLAGQLVFLPIAWMPWQLGLIDRMWEAPSPRRVAWLALVSAQWFLGCHPQAMMYGLLVLIAYTFVRGFCAPRTRALKRTVLAFTACAGLGAGLILIQVIPCLEMSASAVRGGGLDYQTSCGSAMPAGLMIERLIFPPIRKPIADWEGAVHVGLAALALSPFAFLDLRRRKETTFWALVALTVLAYTAGTPICRWAYQFIPGFDRLRIPPRALFLLALPLAYLAAAGVDALAQQAGRPRWRWALALFTCTAGLAFYGLHPDGQGQKALLCFAMPLLLLVLPFSGAQRAGLAALAIFFDQGSFAAPMVQTRRFEEALGTHPGVAAVYQPRGTGRTVGVGYMSGSMPDCYAVPGHVEKGSGYNALVPRLALNYLVKGLSGDTEVGATDINMMPLLMVRNRVYLDVLGFRYVVARDPIAGMPLPLRHKFGDFGGVYDLAGVGRWPTLEYFVYENSQAFPRSWLVSGACLAANPDEALQMLGEVDSRKTLVLEQGDPVAPIERSFPVVDLNYGRNGFKTQFETDVPAFLAISEMHFPGWRATDNGKHVTVLRAGGSFCALKLDAGLHDIRFFYWPKYWGWTLVAAAVSLLLCGLGLFWRGRSD